MTPDINRIMPPTTPSTGRPRAVLIGTAQTVGLLSEQLALLPDSPEPVGFVLVDESGRVAGFDTLESLPKLVTTLGPNLAIVSLPRSASTLILKVRTALASLDLPERFVPPLTELLSNPPVPTGTRTLAGRTMNWADLIGRTPHGVDRASIAGILEGKRVLITGAGGSIGSEIARIVATFKPAQIILMERAENALFEVDRQIAERFPAVQRKAILHDITNTEATLRHLTALRPHIVFHAAAHKHVPLMEDHPAHAVSNNFFGTKSIADASLATGVERFVLISSDKAVNPSSVMGATKRLAETYTQALHRQARAVSPSATRFSMVRFGNVLGSACSVLPIWSSQIEAGRPITVTDSRMTRYFMTIAEAAMLVIQAASLPAADFSAPVYVLDMGEPVRILDLARRFLSALGFTPHVSGEPASLSHTDQSAEIILTGARPGEKLHEELAYSAEQLNSTQHPGIRSWTSEASLRVNMPQLVADLRAVRESADRDPVLAAIRRHVPEMIASTSELKPFGSAITKPEQNPAVAA